MATRVSKIRVRQGNFADLPVLDPGEIGYAKDSRRLFIGNDTGFSHLSVAYNKKTYVILGDCPPHTYSNLIINIDKDEEVVRSINSIQSIKIEKVLNHLSKNFI